MNTQVLSISQQLREIDPNVHFFESNGEYFVLASSKKAAIALCDHRYLFTLNRLKATIQYQGTHGLRTAMQPGFLDTDSKEHLQVLPQKFFLDGYNSPWLSERRDQFGLFAPTEFLYRCDDTGINQGLPCVAIKVWSHPDQLNKPPGEYLNAPLRSLWDKVALPREAGILNVAGDPVGSTCHFEYEAIWRDRLWEFHCSAIKVSQSECHVMVHDKNPKQREFWMAYR